MGRKRTATVLFALFATFGIGCYGAYFLKLLVFPEGTTAMVLALTVLAGMVLPIVFHKKLSSVLGRWYRVLQWGMTACLAFYAISFCVLVWWIYGGVPQIAAETYDHMAVVVPGAKVNGGEPGSILRIRLDRAVSLLEEHPTALCIVSGGQGPDETATEASVMKSYLIRRGIPAQRIFTEEKARNTAENIKYTKELVEQEGLAGRHMVFVSSDTHISRIRLLTQRWGMAADYVPVPLPEPWILLPTLVREYMSYANLLLLGADGIE